MTRRIKSHRKLKAIDKNVTDYCTRYCNVIVLNSMCCLNCICADTVISLYRGRFYARCAKNSSLYQEYRYIEDRYIGVLSHTFYCNFCRDIAYLSLYRGYRYIEDRYIGVLSHTFYCNFCLDIAYLSLYRGYRYIEDGYIGVLSHTFYCNFCRDIAYLTIIPPARMGSESIAHEAEGRMGY